MKSKKIFQKGQGELVSFILLLFFSVLVLCLFYFFSVYRINATKTIKEYNSRIEADKLISEIETDFQILTGLQTDTKDSQEINFLLNKYSKYEIKIEDISSGININFLNKKYLKDNFLQQKLFISEEAFQEIMKIISARKWLESGTLINKYLTDYGKNNIKYYGWINPSFVDNDFMNNLKKNDCSIILNNQSILNIYFTDSEIIKYFVTHQDFKISQSEEKYDRLINEINYNQYINKEKIKQILEVQDDNKILAILGVKTQFWKVYLNAENARIQLIIAAIPNDNIIQGRIYKVIKREINYEERSF